MDLKPESGSREEFFDALNTVRGWVLEDDKRKTHRWRPTVRAAWDVLVTNGGIGPICAETYCHQQNAISGFCDRHVADTAETAALSARLADAEAENTRLRALMVDPNEEHKCLVCRQPRPAGIWEGRPNARVCVECRDAPAGKFAAEARLARAEAALREIADHRGALDGVVAAGFTIVAARALAALAQSEEEAS